jgi:hypothetical protein
LPAECFPKFIFIELSIILTLCLIAYVLRAAGTNSGASGGFMVVLHIYNKNPIKDEKELYRVTLLTYMDYESGSNPYMPSYTKLMGVVSFTIF